MIYGNVSGGFGMPKTIELTDENGYTVVGAVTGSKVLLTAKPSDVKIGKIAATDEGITEGTDTKTYRVDFSSRLILPGQNFSIILDYYDMYDYTNFQAMIAKFNTTQSDSTSVEKVALNDALFNVNSNTKLSDITKNQTTKSIDLNITNNTDNAYIVYYNTYKEE